VHPHAHAARLLTTSFVCDVQEVAESSFDFLHYSIVDTFSRCECARVHVLGPLCKR
jgi:hypothetical protein